MKTQQLTAVLSKTPTDGSGRFEAIAYDGAAGDVDGMVITTEGIDSGVRKFNQRGRPLVLRWQHRTDHPDEGLGTITRMWREGSRLMIAGQLDLTNPLSERAYEAMLTGRLNEFSIGWVENTDATAVRGGVRFMNDIDLLEVSVVTQGANRGTQLVSVKAVWAREIVQLREQIKALVSDAPSPLALTIQTNPAAARALLMSTLEGKAAAAESERKRASEQRQKDAVAELERFQVEHVPPSKSFPWDARTNERPERPAQHLGESISIAPLIKRSPRTRTKDESARIPTVAIRR